MPYIEATNGRPRLYYRETGQGEPLVLFNGLSQSTANWTSHISALSEHYRVIAWDARGQGRSTLGNEPLNLDVHRSDTCVLLDYLAIESAHLVGFSHGARVALSVAAHAPERADSLTVTSIGSDDDPYRNLIIRSWQEVLERGGIEALAWVTTTHILGRDFLRQYADQMDVMIRTVKERNSEESLRALLNGLTNYPPTLEEASRVTTRSCLITSTQDPLVSEYSADALASALEPTHRWQFDDCGHTIPVERNATWRKRLLTFLSANAAQ